MLTPTHHKMSKIIYDQFIPDDKVMISRTNFIKGSAAPDFIKSFKTYGHNIPESLDFVIDLINDLVSKKHHREDFGFKLGTITHFIADYACTYHANPVYIKRNIAEHLLYEYKIEQLKINPKMIMYTKKYIESFETLHVDLQSYFENHKHYKPDPKRDFIQAIQLIKRICDLVIFTYKKNHVIEERKLEHQQRVVIFSDTFYPQINGVSNTLYQYIKFLDFHHIPYILVSPKYKNNYHKVEKHMLIHRVPGIKLFFYKDNVIALPIFQKYKIYKMLDDFQPTIIHNMTEFSLGRFGKTYAQKRHIPFVTNFSTNFVEYLPYYNLGFLKPIAWHFFRKFHNQSQLTLCPSHTTKTLLEAHGFKHIALFGRGIEQELFSPTKYNHQLRINYAKENKQILLYVGRISKEKHIDTLIESYKQLIDQNIAVALVIVGDGPYLSELKQKSPSSIIFTGYKKHEDLQEIYASSDLFVFPSPSETLGNVVLEAMSSGLPVIGVNAGGVKENIIHGYNGYLCEVDNVKDMTLSIASILKNNKLKQTLKENALTFTKKKSWSFVFNKLMNNYHLLS